MRQIKFRAWDNSKYDIGSDGSIWSNDFNNSGKRKELKKYYDRKDGYMIVYLTINNKRKVYPVRKLVAITFLGKRPDKLVINHKNGVRDDDRAENLEYVTSQYNAKDGWNRGRKVTPKMREVARQKMIKINNKKYGKNN